MSSLKLDIHRSDLPKLIAIEGPIGVGKSSLALRIAETLDFETVLESTG